MINAVSTQIKGATMFSSKRVVSVPPKKTQMWTVVIEVIGLLIISYPLIHIYLFTGGKWPKKRGFFCDDESLKHPIVEETISTGACFIIWAAISIVVVVSVEVLHFLVFHPNAQEANRENMFKVPFVVLELFRIVGFFVIGAVINLLIIEIAKFSIGRLRPHFLTILVKCNIFEVNDANCAINGYQKFVELDYAQEFITNDKNCNGNV